MAAHVAAARDAVAEGPRGGRAGAGHMIGMKQMSGSEPIRERPQRTVRVDPRPRGPAAARGRARAQHPRVAVSARKHGIPDADILHAWRNFLRVDEQDYGGESRVIAVGPARDGALLELVLVPADAPTRVIHADNARRSFLARLR